MNNVYNLSGDTGRFSYTSSEICEEHEVKMNKEAMKTTSHNVKIKQFKVCDLRDSVSEKKKFSVKRSN